MNSFKKYVNYYDNLNEDIQQSIVPQVSNDEDPKILNIAVEIAVKKGHKDVITKFLRDLGDDQINKELDDVDGGLGNVTKSNSKDVSQNQDEVVPSPVDHESPDM